MSRYLLMLDVEGEVIRGFQLSTSASAAMSELPLLVNEIARSALPAVVELVAARAEHDELASRRDRHHRRARAPRTHYL
jgi:hypothetical protein